MIRQPFLYPNIKNITESCTIQYFFLLLCGIWQEMTGDRKQLLAVFEVRLQDLLILCDERDEQIKALTETIRQMKDEYRILNTKYTNLLTAAYLTAADKGEKKEVKRQLSDLVREVDKCLALLNE